MFQSEDATLVEVNPLVKTKDGKVIALDGKIVAGSCDIDQGVLTRQHTAIFGLLIAQEYRHQGLGFRLATQTINQAFKEIKGLEIIKLSVYSENEQARKLYKKIGFHEYGNLPQGLEKWDGSFDDEIEMYLTKKEWNLQEQ